MNHKQYHFSLTRRDAASSEWLSIDRTRQIRLPAGVVTGRGVTRYRRAHLYWDVTSQAIAIIFTPSDTDETAFPLRFIAGGATIAARRFFRANDLNVDDLAGRYPLSVVPARELGIPSDEDAFLIKVSEKAVK